MLEGSIVDGVHRLELRVYYEDTDFSGFVYHANYLKFCERGRSDFLRLLGLDQKAMMAADGLMFVVRRMVCDFLKPARFNDVLTVETVAVEQAGARFEMRQRVLCGDVPLFTADVTAVLVDGRGKPRRMPPQMVRLFVKPAS